MNIKTDLFNEVEIPVIVLSTRWHKHLGTIENVDKSTISFGAKLNAADEFSFDVYKVLDNHECTLWNDIVDFKFIYVPIHNAYYEIQVSIDEDDKTIKHVTAVAACEAELDQRLLRNFECNTEIDIAREDYDVEYPTVFYREDPEHQDASLLHRVLHDKCQDYKIIHVDSSLKNIQRTFSTDGTGVYSFLTGDVAETIGCLFIFDSIERGISAYDLKCNCIDCNNRGLWENECPECGSLNCTYGYGKFTQVFISPENFAQSLSMEGDADSVKNCFKIEGGDDLMTSTVANINPNGSQYIYRFSEFMLNDMPEELKNKIISYNELYDSKYADYKSNAEKLYKVLDDIEYYTHKQMPEIVIPDTDAEKEASKLYDSLSIMNIAVNNKNLQGLSEASAELAIKGVATSIINALYETSIYKGDKDNPPVFKKIDNKHAEWTGKLLVTLSGYEVDNGEKPDTKKQCLTDTLVLSITNENYEDFIRQKIQKMLDRKDAQFNEVYKIDDIEEFKNALTEYSLNSLKGFESSYDACIEVLIQQGITKDSEDATDYFGINIYEDMYVPYYDRLIAIRGELDENGNVLVEGEIQRRQKTIDDLNNKKSEYEAIRKEISNELDFKKYIGDDLWKIFNSYMREDTYSNSNFISDGKDNAEIISLAEELVGLAKDELYKSSEMQLTLSSSLNDLLLHEEFKGFKHYIDLGNWIITKVDGLLYRLRITDISFDYGSPENISITFSNVTRYKDYVSDMEDILNKASEMTSSFNYVANEASKGKQVSENYNRWIEEGLDSALVNIKNNDKEEVTFDEHGILARSFDDIINDYSDEQLKITHNCIAFTYDNWKTCSAALGKHLFTKYNSKNNNWYKEEGYGLSADFVQSGHIYGTTIVSGHIYSHNYSDGSNNIKKAGTYFNLETGEFTMAGGKLTYDPLTDKINYTGSMTLTGGSLTVRKDKSSTSNILFQANIDSNSVNIAGFTVNDKAIYKGTTNISDWNHAGIYIGTDGICCASTDITKGVQITNGILKAWGAEINKATIDEASIPNLSAAKITSGALTIANDTGTLFQADISKQAVWIAGFTVSSYKKNNTTYGAMRYNMNGIADSNWKTSDGNPGIFIGTEGIMLTDGKGGSDGLGIRMKDGVLECWGAKIRKADIDVASIPNLDASKITSGEISTDRLSSKVITTDNLSAKTISANQITAGTLSVNRLERDSDGYITLGTAASVGSGTLYAGRFQFTGGGSWLTSSGVTLSNGQSASWQAIINATK